MAIFLLGGCDLEMAAIKRLLKRYNQKFIDKNLKWGAKLSDYKEEIEKYKNEKIYAIELIEDIKTDNITLIDHHNELSSKPSSIEQIAALLNHKLSSFEKAVALNDKGYIYEMLKNNINLSDIKRIRRLDRKAQGVTKEEEEAAKNIKLKRIIYFPYEHFSPLTDRIFFEKGWRKFIIYNDNLTMFYGFDIDNLKEVLKKFNITPSFWGKGYLGVLEKIDERVLKEIYKMKNINSIHTFMFPFVIKNKDTFKEILEKEWEKKPFTLSKVEYYNEFVYFYPHVRDVVFGINDGIAAYFEKNLKKDNKYIITLINGEKFELEIEDISLRVFNDSIGILSFHLINYEYNHLDILKINEYGRRIFPQFLGDKLVKNTKETFLADSIEIILDGEEFSKEDFSKFNEFDFDVNDIKKNLIPDFIKKLIGEDIEAIIDDRMFVISFYLDDGRVVDRLTKFENNSYSYINDDWWYKYVFVDGNSKTCQNKIFCPELLRKATYDRWVEYSTLWGITRYSFVGVAKRNPFSEGVLLKHAQTLYYQMMVLLLMYRAMIVHFSDEVQNIVDGVKNDKLDIKEVKENSKNLYREYLKFLNGLYFREVTPQEQGIEIYKKALDIMEIEVEIKDFDREISELDSYIEFLAEEERNKELEKLNKLGALFLPPTLLASLLGMNVGVFDDNKQCKFLIAIILFILSIRLGELQFLGNKKERILEKIFSKLNMSEEKEKIIILWVLIISIILLGLI